MSTVTKPLGRKAYGSIGHLPGSRMGPGDHKCPDGYYAICCKKLPEKHCRVIVQEKLDGSCVAVARIDGILHPLGRAGWPASSSRYEQHRLFDRWVWENQDRFMYVLEDGERIVGEWLAQAHGTRYDLGHREPFVAFDIMRDDKRITWPDFYFRTYGYFQVPRLPGFGPMTPEDALKWLGEKGDCGALDPIEGVVYRCERRYSGNWRVEFLAKYVRPDKCDGCYLPEVSGKEAVWNWRPEESTP